MYTLTNFTFSDILDNSEIISGIYLSITDSLGKINEVYPGNVIFNSKNKKGGLQFAIKHKDKNIVLIFRSLAITIQIYGTESKEYEFEQTITLTPSNYDSIIDTVIKIIGEKLVQ